MPFSQYICLCSGLCLITLVVCTSTSGASFFHGPLSEVRFNSFYVSRPGIELSDCVTWCNTDSRCKSVSYNADLECRLSELFMLNNTHLMEVTIGWKYYEKVE